MISFSVIRLISWGCDHFGVLLLKKMTKIGLICVVFVQFSSACESSGWIIFVEKLCHLQKIIKFWKEESGILMVILICIVEFLSLLKLQVIYYNLLKYLLPKVLAKGNQLRRDDTKCWSGVCCFGFRCFGGSRFGKWNYNKAIEYITSWRRKGVWEVAASRSASFCKATPQCRRCTIQLQAL